MPLPSSSMLSVTASARSSWVLARSTAALARATRACWSARVSRTSAAASPSSRVSRTAMYTPAHAATARLTAAISAATPVRLIWLYLPLASQPRLTGSPRQERSRLVRPRAMDAGSRVSHGPVRKIGFPCRDSWAHSTYGRPPHRGVLLRHDAFRHVVRVYIAFAVAQALGTSVVRVTQVRGDGTDKSGLYVGLGGADRLDDGV